MPLNLPATSGGTFSFCFLYRPSGLSGDIAVLLRMLYANATFHYPFFHLSHVCHLASITSNHKHLLRHLSLDVQIIISAFFFVGVIYLCFILVTFARYGEYRQDLGQ
jgi:hypothetical protein